MVRCPTCGSDKVEAVKSWDYRMNRVDTQYRVTYYRCLNCGQKFNHYVRTKGSKGREEIYVKIPPPRRVKK